MYSKMKTTLVYIVFSVLLAVLLIPSWSGKPSGEEGETQLVKYSLARPSYDGSYGLIPGASLGPAMSIKDFSEPPMELEDWMSKPENWKKEDNKMIINEY